VRLRTPFAVAALCLALAPGATGQTTTAPPDAEDGAAGEAEPPGADPDLPDQDLPDVGQPDQDLPDVGQPDQDLPDQDLPDQDLPSGEQR